ncbi:carbohydrate ABC transporter permease [Anaerotalea alkaliphila]|uniref:Carbohydrate ABC transporter permease n=1 Tax=Anaerotalea alkaliphila TaxID=2662126 RepID=A0A7X5HV96_9FIRM|nr:carbohydrate ABC transporter permease [Anaerotalea alkaliphila]NDL67282.1 carbohydrate ABC transporter permease [Anaerotalea alkaliphila]
MRKRKLRLGLLELFGILLALLYISPFYIVFANSVKTKKDILTNTIGLPVSIALENFPMAMEKMDFLQAFTNSAFITTVSLAGLVLFSSMAAWVLVRNKTRISGAVFMLFVLAMLIPFQAVMLPLVDLFGANKLDLLNSRMGIIFMYLGFGSSMSIFLFHGFVKGIPVDLENAAYMDGCNVFQVFYHIILPLIKPISITVAILNGIWIWNDFLLPSLVLQEKSVRTIPLAAQYFFGAYSKDWHYAMAALTLAIIPVVIFYVIAQKQIIKGTISGALK